MTKQSKYPKPWYCERCSNEVKTWNARLCWECKEDDRQFRSLGTPY